uniref:F-ATPase subunit 8 n=1 Tax=Smynthurodes betae TaxID=196486 RepID=B5WZ30_9HEMI|nr:F-ATPase subunit 8 [Smynthurodes betae]
MPQMAPMNWLFLFMYFIIMLYMNSTLIYFMLMKNPIFNKKNIHNLLKNNNKFI